MSAAAWPVEQPGPMAFLLVIVAAVVLILVIVLFAVHKIRPRLLRVTASVVRWLCLSLEIQSPHGGPGRRRPRRHKS